MATGQSSNRPVVSQVRQILDQFKYEVAQEIAQSNNDPSAHLLHQYLSGETGGYGGNIPARIWGAVGGRMVRRMIQAAEQSLIDQVVSSTQVRFRQQLGQHE